MGTGGDRRDDQTWAVIELSRSGETALEDGSLCERLRSDLHVDNSWEIFIPASAYTRMGRRITLYLVEGYVFVAAGLADTAYFNLERSNPLVRRVLSVPGPRGMRVLSTIPDTEVETMREQLRAQIAVDISKGMEVRITEGVYSPLKGRVLHVEGDDAHVLIELRSVKIIKDIPRVFLEPVEDESKSGAESE